MLPPVTVFRESVGTRLRRSFLDIKVRDSRRPGHFWADNELLDVYGPKIGMDGLAVYMALSRVANNRNGECVITLRQIGEMIGCSPQTAMRAIEKLSRYKLVRIESKGSVATRQPSVYTLLEVPKFSVPIGNNDENPSVPSPVPSSVPSPVPIGNTLKTINTNNTNQTEALSLFADEVPEPEKNKTKKKAIIIPDWVPADAWAAYVEMRAKKHPLTDRAKELELRDLEELKNKGEDVRKVLERSIKKCWRGLYPEKNLQQDSYNAVPVKLEETEDALSRERRKEQTRREATR